MKCRKPQRPHNRLRLVLWVVAGILLAVITLLTVLQLTSLWRHACCVYLPLLPPLLGLLAALDWEQERRTAIFYLVMIFVVFAAMLLLREQLIDFYQILFRLLWEQ